MRDMIPINLRKILIALVVIIVLGPPIGLYVQHKLFPPVLLYELSYTEILSEDDKATGNIPVILNFCFEVPTDLNLKGDLQDFMVTLTKKDIKNIVMTDVTDIRDFNYKAREGCGDYAVKIEAEDTRSAYQLYRNGEIK